MQEVTLFLKEILVVLEDVPMEEAVVVLLLQVVLLQVKEDLVVQDRQIQF
tara:strand:- start:241 stop:390 length:150 start_codon:yes stop_codon:yes gene_type:complete